MEKLIDKISNDQLDKKITESKYNNNSLEIVIPYLYFLNFVELNWQDILFAIENGFLTNQSAIQHAIKELEKKENDNELVFELAILNELDSTNEYKIDQILYKLSKKFTYKGESDSKDKVLFVLLNWIFDNKDNYIDPLRVIEIIYADFDYPIAMKNFIRYEESSDKKNLTETEKITELINSWSIFVERKKINKHSCLKDI